MPRSRPARPAGEVALRLDGHDPLDGSQVVGGVRPVAGADLEQIRERRSIGDGVAEAILQGLVRVASIFAASGLVRQLASSWQ